MEKALLFYGERSGYSPRQCRDTMTVDEMIEYLKEIKDEYGGNTLMYLDNDNGYTYGHFHGGYVAALKGDKVIEVSELEDEDYDEFWKLVEEDSE